MSKVGPVFVRGRGQAISEIRVSFRFEIAEAEQFQQEIGRNFLLLMFVADKSRLFGISADDVDFIPSAITLAYFAQALIWKGQSYDT
ncbi:MAG TPA: hypothetical protein VLZ74_08805 [Methylocella sp.]|nr:hypothetical protein [Methylocella sp.]